MSLTPPPLRSGSVPAQEFSQGGPIPSFTHCASKLPWVNERATHPCRPDVSLARALGAREARTVQPAADCLFRSCRGVYGFHRLPWPPPSHSRPDGDSPSLGPALGHCSLRT